LGGARLKGPPGGGVWEEVHMTPFLQPPPGIRHAPPPTHASHATLQAAALARAPLQGLNLRCPPYAIPAHPSPQQPSEEDAAQRQDRLARAGVLARPAGPQPQRL
jgi:hypothetical protein